MGKNTFSPEDKLRLAVLDFINRVEGDAAVMAFWQKQRQTASDPAPHTARFIPKTAHDIENLRAINLCIKAVGGLAVTLDGMGGLPDRRVRLSAWLGHDPENEDFHRWLLSDTAPPMELTLKHTAIHEMRTELLQSNSADV